MTQEIKELNNLTGTNFDQFTAANNLADYRAMRGKTQRDAAHDLGLTQPQLSNYESLGTVINLKFSLLLKMAAYYETDILSLAFTKKEE